MGRKRRRSTEGGGGGAGGADTASRAEGRGRADVDDDGRPRAAARVAGCAAVAVLAGDAREQMECKGNEGSSGGDSESGAQPPTPPGEESQPAQLPERAWQPSLQGAASMGGSALRERVAEHARQVSALAREAARLQAAISISGERALEAAAAAAAAAAARRREASALRALAALLTEMHAVEREAAALRLSEERARAAGFAARIAATATPIAATKLAEELEMLEERIVSQCACYMAACTGGRLGGSGRQVQVCPAAGLPDPDEMSGTLALCEAEAAKAAEGAEEAAAKVSEWHASALFLRSAVGSYDRCLALPANSTHSSGSAQSASHNGRSGGEVGKLGSGIQALCLFGANLTHLADRSAQEAARGARAAPQPQINGMEGCSEYNGIRCSTGKGSGDGSGGGGCRRIAQENSEASEETEVQLCIARLEVRAAALAQERTALVQELKAQSKVASCSVTAAMALIVASAALQTATLARDTAAGVRRLLANLRRCGGACGGQSFTDALEAELRGQEAVAAESLDQVERATVVAGRDVGQLVALVAKGEDAVDDGAQKLVAMAVLSLAMARRAQEWTWLAGEALVTGSCV